MKHPHLGNTVRPATETANGTSSLQGMAAVTARQNTWHCAFRTEQPSHSGLHPTQIKGTRQGALGLQQHSRLQQQIPAWKKNEEMSVCVRYIPSGSDCTVELNHWHVPFRSSQSSHSLRKKSQVGRLRRKRNQEFSKQLFGALKISHN